jgi:hypothetical protein
MTEAELELQQPETSKTGDKIVGGSLVFVAIRCTIQYVLLPFVLPFVGLTNNFSVILSTIFEVIALTAIAYNLVHLWNTNWRTRYLILSAFSGSLILVFLYYDIQYLLNL